MIVQLAVTVDKFEKNQISEYYLLFQYDIDFICVK